MAKPGQGNTELHEFLVTLVTQLFEAEAQAKKADKKEAQATAALLANVQAGSLTWMVLTWVCWVLPTVTLP